MAHPFKHKLIFALLICFFSFTNAAMGCDCPLLSPEEAIKKAPLIVSGKIVGAEYRKGITSPMMESPGSPDQKKSDYETLVLTVQVNEWWKSEAPKEISLIIADVKLANGNLMQSSCNYPFDFGGSYLIYVYGEKGRYSSGICSGTRKLAQAAKDLELLGTGKKPLEKLDSNKN